MLEDAIEEFLNLLVSSGEREVYLDNLDVAYSLTRYMSFSRRCKSDDYSSLTARR